MSVLDWIQKIFARVSSVSDETPAFLCVGLGNPGEKYVHTRHNAGFEVIDSYSLIISGIKKYPCQTADSRIGSDANGKRVVLAKPVTFMNDSGRAVQELLESTGLTPADCLVVVDDFNLPLGKLRFRKNGSDGGHNGLKSIISHIGPEFPRLRIGIGPIPRSTPIIDFVLGSFSVDEVNQMTNVAEKAAEAIVAYSASGIETAMSRFN